MTASAPAPHGFRVTVTALALGQILSWAVLFYGFSSFVLPMQRELGWGQATLMGAFTVGLTVWGAVAYAVGAAIDHGQGRRVMTGGALLGAAGFALWSQAQAPWQLYVAWLLLGVAQACNLYEPAFTLITRRFPEHFRQGITALTLVGGFASTLSYPSVAALQAGLGWRGALLALAALMALVVAPLHAWALRGVARHEAARAPDALAGATLHQALRHRAFWLLTATFLLYAFISAAVWAHVMPAFIGQGLSEAQALSVLVWFGPAQVAGRLLQAVLGRHWPLRKVGLVVLMLLALALVLFALGHSVPVMLAFALLFGVANGLLTIVRGAIVPEYFGHSHVGRIGGAMSAIGLLSRAAAPLASAGLLLLVPGYAGLMAVLAGLGLVAVATFWVAGPGQALRVNRP